MSKKNSSKNATVAKSSSSKTTTRACSNSSKLGPSRGSVFRNGSGGAAPKLQFRTRSVTAVKNTSGSAPNSFAKVLRFLIYALPVCLFFSYYPIIPLGGNESMNFELSVPLLWLVVFDVVGLAFLVKGKRLFGGLRGKWVWWLFPAWLTLSLVWSLNRVRGFLTVGILWLIYLAGYIMWSLREVLDTRFRERWLMCFLGASLVVCGWCILQCILDLAGVSREASLMCEGCTYQMFGFPHPNGFAIEPQFMGNLLLAPIGICVWLLLMSHNNRNLKPERSRGVVFTTAKADSAPYFSTGSSSVAVVKTMTGSRFLCFKFLLLYFFIIVTTLFLMFSRGAIYSAVVGMVAMSVMVLVQEKKKRSEVFKRICMVWGVVILSFVVALNAQGVMVELGPTSDTYLDGVAKVLNHLSLGIIDIRGGEEGNTGADGDEEGNEVVEKPVENSADNFEETEVEKEENGGGGKQNAIFQGYVAESTDTRVRLSGAAVKVWSLSPTNVLLGVGLGGAGYALYDNGLSPAPKEIVQNEYASLLLETGVIGVSLFVLTLVLVFRLIWRRAARVLLLGIVVSYGVSLMFFSGLPNALHIYLLPMTIYVLYDSKKVNSPIFPSFISGKNLGK